MLTNELFDVIKINETNLFVSELMIRNKLLANKQKKFTMQEFNEISEGIELSYRILYQSYDEYTQYNN